MMMQLERLQRRLAVAQATVELALVMPIFLLMTVGVIDLSRACWAYISIQNAVREGARSAILIELAPLGPGLTTTSTTGVVSDAITEAEYLGFDSSPLVTSLECGDSPISNNSFTLTGYDSSGAVNMCNPTSVTFTATYTFHPIVTMLMGNAALPMTASATVYEP